MTNPLPGWIERLVHAYSDEQWCPMDFSGAVTKTREEYEEFLRVFIGVTDLPIVLPPDIILP